MNTLLLQGFSPVIDNFVRRSVMDTWKLPFKKAFFIRKFASSDKSAMDKIQPKAHMEVKKFSAVISSEVENPTNFNKQDFLNTLKRTFCSSSKNKLRK